MSLDVYLYREKLVSYDKGKTFTEESEQVYWANITHNLGGMAEKAGIYNALWRPEEIGAKTASEITPIIQRGLSDMVDHPEIYKVFNASNGWGTYDQFIPWIQKYLDACIEYPDAVISVSR